MSIKRTFNGATIIEPGAYTKMVVENLTGFPLQETGIVGIIGEAVGGEPRVLDILTKTQIQDAKARYKEGPIADALELLVNPSKDPRVANGASKIVIYKPNLSTQSTYSMQNTIAVPVDQVKLDSKNYGSDENEINMTSSEGSVEDLEALITGSVAAVGGSFTLAGGETLILKCNGVVYTYTSTLGAGAFTIAALVADMDNGANWAAAKPVIVTALPGDFVKITLDPSVITGGELDYGYIKVDATSTIDTILGIIGENRGQKGSRILLFKKDLEEETTAELGGISQLSIKYVGTGTLAKLSIKDTLGELKFTTDITGTPADNLDLVLQDVDGKNKYTLSSLAEFINAKSAYECSVVGPNVSMNANLLDYHEDFQIEEVAGVLKSDIEDLVVNLNNLSKYVQATKLSNVYRAVATFVAPVFFTGASDGTSTNSDWADGFAAFEEERINEVVTLISKDIGSLTIDSINTLLASHVTKMWSTLGKSERNGYASYEGSKADLKEKARALNSGYTSMLGEPVKVLNKFSELVWLDPWAGACIAAGMQAGSEVGEPTTYKLINVNDVRVTDNSWSPKKDAAEMIDAGVMVLRPIDTGGFRIQLWNTTYGVDANFVWNRGSVVEAGGYVSYDLRYNLEAVYTGTKARTGTAEAIANFIKNRMTTYLTADIIVGDDLNEGLGYKNLRVEIEGNTAIINVSITPVQGIDFILPTIYLADIRQSA